MNNNFQQRPQISMDKQISLSDLSQTADQLLMGLRLNVDPMFTNIQNRLAPNTFANNQASINNLLNLQQTTSYAQQQHQRIENSRDLPRLVSPKPQRPTVHGQAALGRTLSSQNFSSIQQNVMRNLSCEFPNLHKQQGAQLQLSSAQTSNHSTNTSSLGADQQFGINAKRNGGIAFENTDQISNISSSISRQNSYAFQIQPHFEKSSFQIPIKPQVNNLEQRFNRQLSSNTINGISSSFSAFQRSPTSQGNQIDKQLQQISFSQSSLLTSQYLQMINKSNSSNESRQLPSLNDNHKISFNSLPEGLSQLLKQASLQLISRQQSFNQQNQQEILSQQNSMLGKRRMREQSQDLNLNSQQNLNLSEKIEQHKPLKRKHVSTLSKAILAKKILSKIESQNEHKINRTHSAVHQNQKDIQKQESIEESSINEDSQSNSQEHNSDSENQAQQKMSENLSLLPDTSIKSCNCKKSKCLKLYCECFANNKFCGANCACNGCSNHAEHDDERLHAKEQILMRNPLAFRPKVETQQDETSLFSKDIQITKINIQEQSDALLSGLSKPQTFGALAVSDKDKRHFRGCNCKKSNCQKKYCECFQQGVNCSDLCKCEECKNNEQCKPCTFEQMFKVQKEIKISKAPLQILRTQTPSKLKNQMPFQDISLNVFSINQNQQNQTSSKPTFDSLKKRQECNLQRYENSKSPISQKIRSLKKNFIGNQENNPVVNSNISFL